VTVGASSPFVYPGQGQPNSLLHLRTGRHPRCGVVRGSVLLPDDSENARPDADGRREAAFDGEADWERLRMELWYANRAMASGRPPSGHTWGAIQHGLNEMLLSPAVKRRAGIKLQRKSIDADVVAAHEMVGKYKRSLKSV
jgi:hypothetical protein